MCKYNSEQRAKFKIQNTNKFNSIQFSTCPASKDNRACWCSKLNNTHFKHHLSIIIIKFLQTVIIKIPLIPTKSLWNWK